jgi:hypothetical protein
MLLDVQRFFVIQNRETGAFLSPNLFWVKTLRQAGRLYDAQEAFDTAEHNNDGDSYDIISFYEQVKP